MFLFQALRVQTQLEADDYEVWCSVQDADDDVDSQPLLSQQSSGASENNILDRSFADSHGLCWHTSRVLRHDLYSHITLHFLAVDVQQLALKQGYTVQVPLHVHVHVPIHVLVHVHVHVHVNVHVRLLCTGTVQLSQCSQLSEQQQRCHRRFQERADDAAVVVAVLSRRCANSKRSKQQVLTLGA